MRGAGGLDNFLNSNSSRGSFVGRRIFGAVENPDTFYDVPVAANAIKRMHFVGAFNKFYRRYHCVRTSLKPPANANGANGDKATNVDRGQCGGDHRRYHTHSPTTA